MFYDPNDESRFSMNNHSIADRDFEFMTSLPPISDSSGKNDNPLNLPTLFDESYSERNKLHQKFKRLFRPSHETESHNPELS